MTRPVKVLFVIDSLTPEAGTENQLLNLLPHLDPNSLEIFVACLEDGARLQSVKPHATPLVFPVARILSPSGIRQLLRFRREINARQIDVVHTFIGRATVFGVLGARFSSCKAIVTSRRNLGYWYSPRSLRVTRVLNRWTTRVLANCEAARAVAIDKEGLPPGRVDVLYNGVDTSRFLSAADPTLRTRLGIPLDAPVVGIVANYRPVKDLPLFLKAAQIVHQSFPDAYFVLVGRGTEQQKLVSSAAELGIAHRTIFTDDQHQIESFYSCFQIACLSSESEGFSNAVLEYMAAGLPVVATDVGGVREAVQQAETGFVVPSGNAQEFAGKITLLLRDEKLRHEMGRRGRERCRQRFDFPLIARQYEDYYQKLVQ